jgi:hypothetical protein
MEPPVRPENEQQRLAAVHKLNIQKMPDEDRFDRYTRLATQIFNVPIALISLVDENHVSLKSQQGLTKTCQVPVPRDQSFVVIRFFSQIFLKYLTPAKNLNSPTTH